MMLQHSFINELLQIAAQDQPFESLLLTLQAQLTKDLARFNRHRALVSSFYKQEDQSLDFKQRGKRMLSEVIRGLFTRACFVYNQAQLTPDQVALNYLL